MKGYLTPLEKAGDIKDENPDKEVMFCVENTLFVFPFDV